jgi:hypothetical protein
MMTEQQKKERMQRAIDVIRRDIIAALGPPMDDQLAEMLHGLASLVWLLRLDLAGIPGTAHLIGTVPPLPKPSPWLLLIEEWPKLHPECFGNVPQRHNSRIALA